MEINCFQLDKHYHLLFFDIFLKNNELILILPVYSDCIDFIGKINIFYEINKYIKFNKNDSHTFQIKYSKSLNLKKKILNIQYEGTIILVYDFPFDDNKNGSEYFNIITEYNGLINKYKLQHFKETKKYQLTLTTLFQNDYNLFNIFYKYYKNQGVEHFYMYYNGKLNQDIVNIFQNKTDVTLIEWDFKYWNCKSYFESHKFVHHAQLGQLHHAIYRYGKDISRYMIFCDFDEYMMNSELKLINLINSDYDTYIFFNIFCQSSDLSINLPITIKAGEQFDLSRNTKCIHKLDIIDYIGVHRESMDHELQIQDNYENKLFHFKKNIKNLKKNITIHQPNDPLYDVICGLYNIPSHDNYPKVIYLCNKIMGNSEIAIIQSWKKLNPEFEIKFYDNEMIKLFLLNEFGELYKNIFDFLEDGPIKADFWRICILYKYGGIYSDIDIEPLVPLSEFIGDDIDFVICSSFQKHLDFNPNFIVSNKDNLILRKCINWYIDKYNNREEYNYWKWSIMECFTQILNLNPYIEERSIYEFEGVKIQIITECMGDHHYDEHNIYNNVRVFNNRIYSWDSVNHEFN